MANLINPMEVVTMANDSILYKNAVGSYNEFIATEQATETLENIIVYDAETREPIQYSEYMPNIYRLLLRAYRNSEIAYSNISDFLDGLWMLIEMHVPNFMERYNRYQQLLKMTDKELLNSGEYIGNFIENTNEQYENPLDEPLKNITNQNSSRNYGDYAGRIRSQIYNARMTLITDFTQQFKDLFLRLNSKSYYYSI